MLKQSGRASKITAIIMFKDSSRKVINIREQMWICNRKVETDGNSVNTKHSISDEEFFSGLNERLDMNTV